MSYNEDNRVFVIEDDWAEEDKGKIALPHSCDEWIIGGVKEARELINDLEILIKRIEHEQSR